MTSITKLCVALALVAAVSMSAASAQADADMCTQSAITACAQAVGPCIAGGGDKCSCFKTELECTEKLGCGPNILSGIVRGCTLQGCSTASCGGPIVNNCNGTAIAGCARTISTCISGGGKLCTCESDAIKCVTELGCGQQVVNAYEKACEGAGCTAAQCTPSMDYYTAAAMTEVPAPEPVVDSDMCTQSAITACAQAVGPCIAGGGDKCSCFKTELECTEKLGCGPNILSGIVRGCTLQGCSTASCGGPIVNNCNGTAIAGCARTISTCVSGGGKLCDCESDAIKCVTELGCGQQIIGAYEKACEGAGCTSAQCMPSLFHALPSLRGAL